jgi:hypothetical protein
MAASVARAVESYSSASAAIEAILADIGPGPTRDRLIAAQLRCLAQLEVLLGIQP